MGSCVACRIAPVEASRIGFERGAQAGAEGLAQLGPDVDFASRPLTDVDKACEPDALARHMGRLVAETNPKYDKA